MTLHAVFVKELKDLTSAENQLVKALPKMVKAAASPDLKKAFQAHLEETKNHVERIKQAFASVSETYRLATVRPSMLCPKANRSGWGYGSGLRTTPARTL